MEYWAEGSGERAVIDYVAQYADDGLAISDALHARVREHFSDSSWTCCSR